MSTYLLLILFLVDEKQTAVDHASSGDVEMDIDESGSSSPPELTTPEQKYPKGERELR